MMAAMVALSACSSIQRDPPILVWWDMKRQAKFRTEGETGFFADGRNTRTPPEDTVAQGYLFDETAYNTGMDGQCTSARIPVPVTAGAAASGPDAIQHLLLAVPRPHRSGQGHRAAARAAMAARESDWKTAWWRWRTETFST